MLSVLKWIPQILQHIALFYRNLSTTERVSRFLLSLHNISPCLRHPFTFFLLIHFNANDRDFLNSSFIPGILQAALKFRSDKNCIGANNATGKHQLHASFPRIVFLLIISEDKVCVMSFERESHWRKILALISFGKACSEVE